MTTTYDLSDLLRQEVYDELSHHATDDAISSTSEDADDSDTANEILHHYPHPPFPGELLKRDTEEEEHDSPHPYDASISDYSTEDSLHGSEDIDFEFVYALHTFVATVEGQANATKGDTMVLLDDSNSYWWLVRVVKDSSIGT